jgi:hypothetical protein
MKTTIQQKEELERVLTHLYLEIGDKLIFFNKKLIKYLQKEDYEKCVEIRELILQYIVDESKVIQLEIGGRVNTYNKTLIQINNTIIQELMLKFLYK